MARTTNPNAYRLLLLLLSQIIWRGWLIVKSDGGKAVILGDIIITATSVVFLAGPYLLDITRFIGQNIF